MIRKESTPIQKARSSQTTISVPSEEAIRRPEWRHVAIFLGLTFGLTWLLDLAIYLRGGLSIPSIAIIQQLQTLLPAFIAIVLSLFVFRESPIFHSRPAGRGRWFYYYFLLLTLVYGLGVMGIWISPTVNMFALATTLPQILTFLGLLFLVVLRLSAGREAMAQVWLSWGKGWYWLVFSLGIIAFYALQAFLNAVTGLGGATLVPIRASAELSPAIILVISAVQSVLLAPLLSIVIFFGEEFGWRGYLQSELFKIGRTRGVLLLGVIWGMWHWPIILMGANYPGHPYLGVLLMTLFSTGNAVVLSYAVLRSGSILLAAFLHGVIDQVLNFIVALGFKPNDIAYSFGIGVYALVLLAIIAILILRDPVWKGKGSILQ